MTQPVTRLRREAKSEWIERVTAWLRYLENKKFFGHAILIFENGYPVAFKENVTMKLEDLPGSD